MTTSAGKSFGWLLSGTLALAAVVIWITFSKPKTTSEILSFSGRTMGTRYAISIVAKRNAKGQAINLDKLSHRVDQRLAEINRRMSTYDTQSELSKFNAYQNDDWFSVSDETAHVVDYALKIAAESDGAFDPTVGPLVNLWGFGPKKNLPLPPSEAAISKALENIGYKQLGARAEPPALRKTNPALYVDLSAIAKGYAVDQISDLLAQLGYPVSMIEIGGEVRTRGMKPGNLPWKIGIEKPNTEGRSIQTIITLSDGAMATSGDYRNFFEHNNVRYSHTIDPTTGRPVEHQLATVTILANSCMKADAIATALLVMGNQQGYDWCEAHDIAALFLIREGESFVELTTPRFEELYGN